jgi:hypothetical protein
MWDYAAAMMTSRKAARAGMPSPEAIIREQRECLGRTGRARTSKIARLPAAVREELNTRLHDGQTAAEILSWANELPEVNAVLTRHFAGQPITEDNLSRWRQGGYAGWLEHRATEQAVEGLAVACGGVDEYTAERLCRQISVVLSARLFAEIQKLAGMAEGPDKTAGWHQLAMAYVLLRKADYYGVKVWQDRMEAKLQEKERPKRPMSTEERMHRIRRILGTTGYDCDWNSEKRIWEGPEAALQYEQEEVERQVRAELKRRHPSGFPKPYDPPRATPIEASGPDAFRKAEPPSQNAKNKMENAE